MKIKFKQEKSKTIVLLPMCIIILFFLITIVHIKHADIINYKVKAYFLDDHFQIYNGKAPIYKDIGRIYKNSGLYKWENIYGIYKVDILKTDTIKEDRAKLHWF